jgi:DNA helicase-2/ATP-dependent DNA helicase PcrA
MPAANHPEYKAELERCRYTLDYVKKTLDATLNRKKKLDSDVEHLKRHQSGDSSQSYVELMVNSLLQGSMEQKLRNLYTATGKPYFARVDFTEEGKDKKESLYIGKMSLMRQEDQEVIIVDWRAPVANLYYEERLGNAHYVCPDGNINGRLTLKRQFSIEEGELREIFDIDITTNDDFLQSYLGASADNRLKEIVSTIQVEQNRIIRADIWKPMIVQGAAGSGKTTIALHRIAYLLYTHAKTLKPESFMIIAPNRLFLNYISEVLPELGVELVSQTTFESFAMNLLGKKFKVKDGNEKLISFIDDKKGVDNEERRLLYKATMLKTSMAFKTILERYVEYVETVFLPKEDFKIEGVVVYSYDEINRLFLKEYKRWPLVKRIDEIKKHLNTRLKAIKEKIVNALQTKSDMEVERLKLVMPSGDERQRLIIEAIDTRNESISRVEANSKKAVNEYVKRISKFSPWEYYTELMDNEELLLSLSEGLADRETVLYLRKYSAEIIRSGFIEIEDFAPLIYLKFLIHGIDEKIPVRQIVIDEVQDFSVFQLYALKMIIKDSSFTLLGDLCQGIHSYRGIKSWKEVKEEVYPDKKPEYLTLQQSYRTSIEIMDAANKVISLLNDEEIILAKPVFRHGDPVRLIGKQSLKDMAQAVTERIRELKDKGMNSIAVICKTLDQCSEIQGLMKKHVPQLQLITGKEDKYQGGMVLVPSYLSKGLEFDAVIIAGGEKYTDSELDIKLLYVAMTRALHKLDIYYTGELTRVLGRVGV